MLSGIVAQALRSFAKEEYRPLVAMTLLIAAVLMLGLLVLIFSGAAPADGLAAG